MISARDIAAEADEWAERLGRAARDAGVLLTTSVDRSCADDVDGTTFVQNARLAHGDPSSPYRWCVFVCIAADAGESTGHRVAGGRMTSMPLADFNPAREIARCLEVTRG